jgi:hypothetical protein
VFSQPIDEVSCYHRLSLSKAGADESLTRYQKGNGFVFAEGGLGIAFFQSIRVSESGGTRRCAAVPPRMIAINRAEPYDCDPLGGLP